MKSVNIKGADELDTYELARNSVNSFWEDKNWLEDFEQKIKILISKFTEKDKDLCEEIKVVECYAWKRIEQILFDIC